MDCFRACWVPFLGSGLLVLCSSVCAQVDKAELQQGMAQIGNPVSDAELAEIMRLCDKDGDGSCDCELQSHPCSVALLRFCLLAAPGGCSWSMISMMYSADIGALGGGCR